MNELLDETTTSHLLSSQQFSHSLFLNKFGPKLFEDFETEPTMIALINTLIQTNKLNILFIGNMGSGKTSYLNAIIREYYGADTITDLNSSTESGENILYINSLKEQGINFYRNEVKTFCQTRCSIKNKKKVVLLDDMDFINEQSQQVFRNCIDKYSHNVHFICSCSNAQKVIESIQSRLFIIRIKPLQKENLIKIMNKIILKEKIHIERPATDFIVSICNNTVKILINYLEKCKLLNETITLELADQICTNISFTSFDTYTNLLQKGELFEAIQFIYSIHDKGYSVMDILDNYFLYVKICTALTDSQKYEIIPLLCKYITIFYNIHEDEIELALFTNNILPILYYS